MNRSLTALLFIVAFLFAPLAIATAQVEPRGAAKPVSYTDADGNVTFICSEVGGKLTGLCGTYFPDGTKKTEKTYVNGKVDGPFKLFYEDGVTVKSSCTFANGLAVGNWFNYYEDGKTIAAKFFFDAQGMKHGSQWDYFESGIPSVYQLFNHGFPTHTIIYDESGKIVEEWDGYNR